MSRIKILIALTIPVIISIYAVYSYSSSTHENEAGTEKKTILVTTFPIYQIVRNVTEGRDGVKVNLLLPSQLGCPHDYALTIEDMKKLAKSDILIINGHGMEEFLGAPVKEANPNILIIDSSEGIKETIQFSEESNKEEAENQQKDSSKSPYEWVGVFKLEPGLYKWSFAKVGGKYVDPGMKMVCLPSSKENPIEDSQEKAVSLYKQKGLGLKQGDPFSFGELLRLKFDNDKNKTTFEISIEKAGNYVFFTEHSPYEFETDEHYLKSESGKDIEHLLEVPESGHHHHHHSGINSHLFVSPRMTAQIVINIATKLSEADPDGKELYHKNAQNYAQRMNSLASEMKELGSRLKNNRIVQPHGIFEYLARDMSLEIIAVLQAHGQEPSASEMIQLAGTIKEKDVGLLLTEPQYSDKVANTLSKETGVPYTMLDPVASGPEDATLDYYETVMRQNLKTLESILGSE